MPNVHTITARSSAGIQEETLSSLVLVENEVQVSVTEDNSSAQETMRLVACDFLESFQILLLNELGPKLFDECQIIDCFRDAVDTDLSRYIVWIDALLVARDVLDSGLKGF